MIYRQLPVIEKSQPIAPKYEIKPGAQHQTLGGRKLIYKIMLPSYSSLEEHHMQVRATRFFKKNYPCIYANLYFIGSSTPGGGVANDKIRGKGICGNQGLDLRALQYVD
jgi:hypothetical protein